MENQRNASTTLTRRSFLKTTGALAGATALTGTLASCSGMAAEKGAASVTEEIKYSCCRNACQGGCMHRITVRDGVAVNATAAEQPNPDYTGICLRGASNIYRTYSDRRVSHPMRRVEGTERGAGQWERISWDEAIAVIAEKLCYYRDTFGGRSIVRDMQAGCLGMVNGPRNISTRLAQCVGMTVTGDCYDRNSCAGTYRVMGVDPYAFSNEPADLPNADMILVWGTNPVYAAPHLWRFVRIAQDQGAKVVCFDPDKTATAHKCDEWISVVPGSDLSIVLAVSNYIIENGLIDEEFVRTRTNAPFLVNRESGEMLTREPAVVENEGALVGYDIAGNPLYAKATANEGDYYVIDADGAAKPFAEAAAPQLEGSVQVDGVWHDTAYSLLVAHLKQYTLADAAELSGVDEEVLERFAREYAAADAVTINCAYGMNQYQNGHLWFQAVCVMQALTGNFGKHGTGLTGMHSPGVGADSSFISEANNPLPIEEIPAFHTFDVWRDQRYKGEDYPLKAMITLSSNPMSNYADQNRWFTDVFPNLEFWVVVDNQWSDSAMHADIVLPSSMWLEVMDFWSGQNTAYSKFADRVIDPLFDSKPDIEIFSLIGAAMGYADEFFPERAMEEWAQMSLDADAPRELGMTWDTVNDKHIFRTVAAEDDPNVIGGHWSPFPTPHGRLMLYWENPEPRADFGQTFTDEEIRRERLAYWAPPREAWKDHPDFEKYPLVCLQVHERFRTHTQHFDNPVLNEIEGDPFVYLARADAEERGIATGDIVEVFNARGHVVLKAVINDDVRPGDVRIPKGWQRSQFIEGGYSELCDSHLDPWGVSACYCDQLCDVRPWND